MNNCITIGIDLGDKKHAVVGLDEKANIVLRRWLPNTADALRTFFERNKFFAEVQNKLLFAATGCTAAELIVQRSDPKKPNMGLITWKGSVVRKEDVVVAKNYLSSDELDTLNRIITIFLETAELRVKRHMDLTLSFWVDAVDKMLSANLFEVLHGPGIVSHAKAVQVSAERYDEFDDIRKKEAARLADEADLAELKRIEEEAKRRNKE